MEIDSQIKMDKTQVQFLVGPSRTFKKPNYFLFFRMKIPKTTTRYCPYCRKKTEQKIKLVSTGAKRGTLTRGSISRAKKRGLGKGIGNKGKWGSRPAISKFKRKTKTTKKPNIMYTCKECGKSKYRSSVRNKRTSKLLQE